MINLHFISLYIPAGPAPYAAEEADDSDGAEDSDAGGAAGLGDGDEREDHHKYVQNRPANYIYIYIYI